MNTTDNSNITLSLQQSNAFKKIVDGKNVFITGPGGSGKTLLIKAIVTHFKNKGSSVQVCAMTGCAANLIGCNARTIHSWAGIRLANTPNNEIVQKIAKSYIAKKNWKNTRVLIIDEVSMMSQKIIELLDAIGKKVRGNNLPMGGIQVIFLGDFFQLPPIKGNSEGQELSGNFCFESNLWFNIFNRENNIVLDKVYRQIDDAEYIDILNQLRIGELKKKNYNRLNEILADYPNKIKRIEEEAREQGVPCIYPTRIYPTREKTKKLNDSELGKLLGETHTYTKTRVRGLILPHTDNEIMRSSFAKDEIDAEYTYLESSVLCEPSIDLKVGAQVMYIINTPLINKINGSQGIITRFAGDTPIVRFDDGDEIPIPPNNIWQSEKIYSIGISQTPLILSWAITIHKSQGATLNRAEIDVGRDIFACGQTYVAMSRIKNIDGLFLKSFAYETVKTNKNVKEFYKQLGESESESDETHIDICKKCFRMANMCMCGDRTHTPQI